MSDATRNVLTDALIHAGRFFHTRGWVPATGGNFSARLSPDRLLMTASGCHKGELSRDDFLTTDLHGGIIGITRRKTSYETGLHTQLYRALPETGAVLHVHSIANTVLSRRGPSLRLSGYELLKVLPGITTHDTALEVPVFDNDQDIPRLAARVDAHIKQHPNLAAYLIAGHGLYAWGETIAQARHRVEALEFMFECELTEKKS